MKKDDLIRLATKRYGKVYDFSQASEHEIENESNVPIRCEKHGTFFETPYHFLNNIIGCFECYKEKTWGKEMR